MITEEQAGIARDFTKSTMCTALINLEVQNTPEKVKQEKRREIDGILEGFNKPLDAAITSMLEQFSAVAKSAGIDPASLYCIYKNWK